MTPLHHNLEVALTWSPVLWLNMLVVLAASSGATVIACRMAAHTTKVSSLLGWMALALVSAMPVAMTGTMIGIGIAARILL